MVGGTTPYGVWPSPLAPEKLAEGGVRIGAVDALPTGEVFWLESRPNEQGRTVLVRGGRGEAPVDVLPKAWSVRSRIHEYGGQSFWLAPAADGSPTVIFASEADQRLYRFGESDRFPLALTPEPNLHQGYRYAAGMVHPDGQVLVCLREDHHPRDGHDEPVDELVAVPMDGSAATDPSQIRVVATGPDFFSAPEFSPDGTWLAWVQWDHPNMPWLATEARVAPWVDGSAGQPLVIASGINPGPGGVEGDSIHGIGWRANGELIFSSDRSGYWNLYRWHPGQSDRTVEAVTEVDLGEIGGPAWMPETRRWAELSDGRLVVVVTTDAVDSVALVGENGDLELVPTPELTVFGSRIATAGTAMVASASGPKTLTGVVEIQPDTGLVTVVKSGPDLGIDPAWFSQPLPISFDQAHAFFYPPTGDGIRGPESEKPPLVVVCHGGPTAHSSPQLDLKIQFWTTRGFAVADVNYRGSSGFGRRYRDELLGNWGVHDVEDCVAVARHLAAAGRVDPDRMVIRGSSAGGLTVLLALITSDVFAAGTSLYGVADLAALATDTHKFESRYLDGLVGRYPQDKAIFDERSPINRTEALMTPMLVMQGLDDKVVPPAQSEAVVAALGANGVPYTYLTFPGEGHGFRQADTIIVSLNAELEFYQQILNLGDRS